LYYLRWVAAKKHEISKIAWTPSKMMLFAGAEAIGGTSSIPSVGNISTVKESRSESPNPGATKGHWSFASIGKKIRRQTARNRSSSAINQQELEVLKPSNPGHLSASPSPTPRESKKLDPEKGSSLNPKKQRGSFSIASSGSKNVVYCDPLSPRSLNHTPVNSPSGQPLVLEVPSFNETFDSPAMRRMFFNSCLNGRISEDEKEIWSQFEMFFGTFVDLSDQELSKVQKKMKDEAKSLLTMLTSKIPQAPEYIDYLSKDGIIITARFFRPLEVELFKKYHDTFRDYLVSLGWVKR